MQELGVGNSELGVQGVGNWDSADNSGSGRRPCQQWAGVKGELQAASGVWRVWVATSPQLFFNMKG